MSPAGLRMELYKLAKSRKLPGGRFPFSSLERETGINHNTWAKYVRDGYPVPKYIPMILAYMRSHPVAGTKKVVS